MSPSIRAYRFTSPKFVAGLSLAMVACGEQSTDSPNRVVDSTVVASIALPQITFDTLRSRGDTRVIAAIARNARGEIVANPALSWSTSTPDVATVQAPADVATISAVGDGEATITAASGNIRATTNVRVRRRISTVELGATDSVLSIGSSLTLPVITRDARGHVMENVTPIFSSENPGSVIVSPTGVLTGLFTLTGNFRSIISVNVTHDGIRRVNARVFKVPFVLPTDIDYLTYMTPASVLPEPVDELGEAFVYFKREGNTMQYKLFWSYLSGVPTSAHIHVSPDGDASAPILVPLSLGATPGIHGIASGSFTAAEIKSANGRPPITLDSLAKVMGVFATYADIHTTRHPAGEAGFLIFSNHR